MSVNGGDAPRDVPPSGNPPAARSEREERGPISESGIRARTAPPHGASGARPSRRPSDPPHFRPLTPYQARLDVEMDDTAISKVRDPSVSIALGADSALVAERRKRRSKSVEAALYVGAGVCIGALLVVTVVFGLRALGF